MTAHPDDITVANETSRQRSWAADIERRAAPYKILGTLPYPKVAFWNTVVETLSPRRNWLTPLSSRLGIPDPLIVFRLLARANRYQVVLLAGGERADLIYAAIAGMCPWIRTRNIVVDAHWQKSGGLFGHMQSLLLKMAEPKLAQVQPHSDEEIGIYSTEFGIPRTKMLAIPWSTSLIGYDITPSIPTEPFILTGGFSLRDYGIFIPAAGQIGIRVKLGVPAASVDDNLRSLVAQYPLVELHTDWSNRQYYEQMAACSLYAMPIQQGLTRSTADRTILNAMYFGKVVVATDSIAPRIYINDGVNGFLVREPTVDAWRRTLGNALGLTDARRLSISRQAALDAKLRFNETVRLGRTLEAVLNILAVEHDGPGSTSSTRSD